ncbi:hypothetical protein ACWEKM_41665 [Streptomyces sp. NPDC004752]
MGLEHTQHPGGPAIGTPPRPGALEDPAAPAALQRRLLAGRRHTRTPAGLVPIPDSSP